MAISPKQQRFVEELLIDDNVTQAYIRAGYSAKSAPDNSYRLFNQPEVQEAIAEARKARSERAEITADMVLQRWWQIATADPNEISQHRRNACRYCHGDNHGYQWCDHAEFVTARQVADDKGKTKPTDDGGYGFDVNASPDPDCPRCNGNGYGHTFIADTRTLSPAARLLYAGMKETKDGIEAKTHDQMAALERVARHLGMFKDRVEHSGKIEVEKLTDDELAAQIAAYERGGKADGPET